jgi:hypothetical protein
MTDENTQDTGTDNGSNGGVTPEKVEQAKAKFAEYETICEEEKQLDDMMAAVRAKKSGVVKDIEGLLGKGPFQYKGEEIVITRRGDTYYFRGKGKSNAIAID